MTTNYGLTTEEALQKLKLIIKEEVRFHDNQKKQTWRNLLWKTFHWNEYNTVTWFGLLGIVLEVMASILSIIYDERNRKYGLVVELLVLLLFFVVLVVTRVREYYLKSNEVRRLISNLLEEADSAIKEHCSISGLPYLTLTETNSISLVWTYRDKKIVNLPHNLLVEGDVIVLGPSRVAPADCRQITSSDGTHKFAVNLEAGETFNPSFENTNTATVTPVPRQRFEVLQAPAKTIFRSYLRSRKKKEESIISEEATIIIKLVETKIIWIILILSMFVGILRWQFLTNEVEGNLIEALVLVPAYTVLPLLPILFPLLFLLVTFYGTARLRILFSTCTKLTTTTVLDPEEIMLEHVHFRKALSTFCEIIYGNPVGLPRSVNLLHALGTITAFCCLDKDGILCYTQPVPEQIFFFKDHKKIKRTHELSNILEPDMPAFDEDSVSSLDEVTGNKDVVNANDVEILVVSGDPKSVNGIVFDDVDWQQQMASLKPLGINMLLNSPCSHPVKSLRDEDFIRHLSLAANSTVVPNFTSCLCSLSKEIGFQESLFNIYKNKQSVVAFRQLTSSALSPPSNFFLSIIKEKHVPFAISSVVNEGRYGVSQLLTQGSADLILESCTDVWNGEEICFLTDYERKKALNFFQRMNITRKCVAFSYRPVFQDSSSFEDIFLEFPDGPPNAKLNEELNAESFSSTSQNHAWMRKAQKDIRCEDLLQDVPAKHQNIQTHQKNTQKQIFLGMVTMTHTLKEDLITMVDQLNGAGVRFVHFSYENELLSRVFCQRLGLETGWNCHISLRESSGTTLIDDVSSGVSDSLPLLNDDDLNIDLDKQSQRCATETSVRLPENSTVAEEDEDIQSNQTYNNYDELYFMSDRSKLPKGIQNMRKHLEEVDDVPLLVPLFTDCNPSAVSEMISLMQDYGDVTCCIGSSLNSHNHQTFARSDVTITLEPVWHESCALKQDGGCFSLDTSVSEADLSMYKQGRGLLSLSAQINSIAASLTSRRSESFPIAALICEARRLTVGLQTGFLFLFSCQLSLSVLMLLTSIFLLPPPLTGLQLLWLLCVILPILSLSLIGTPADENLMKIITGKRKTKKISKDFVLPYLQQLLPPFLLNVLFISLVLYPWLLYGFCKKMHSNCHWLFGNRNVSSLWHGLHNELHSQLNFTQDLVLFVITFSFILYSFSFVHRTHQLWTRLPFNNKPWCYSVTLCALLQILFTTSSITYWRDVHKKFKTEIQSVSPYWFVVLFTWLSLMILFNELLKRKYIRTRVRFQKREKLKFDTKLGMNSPV